jgi:hypothetical protein
MAIFSRRTLQRFINENAKFIEERKLRQHINNLNNINPEQYLSYEWEVAILNIFSKVGKLTHEPVFGKKTPDILFSSYNNDCNFIAEILTISDQYFEEQNPIEHFRKEFERVIKKNNLDICSFNVRVEGNNGIDFLKEKKKLKLPRKEEFNDKIFKKNDFLVFLSKIKSKPESQHDCVLKDSNLDLHITYHPHKFRYHPLQKGFGMSHPYYRGIFDTDIDYSKQGNRIVRMLKNNVVYRGLDNKCKYLKKIKDSNSLEEKIGVILCDGGCDLIHNSSNYYCTLEKILNTCLYYNSYIDFILVVKTKKYMSSPPVSSIFFSGRNCDKQISDHLYEIVNQALDNLPNPISNADNAIANLRLQKNKGFSFHGGGRFAAMFGGWYSAITLSLRSLLELFAGELKQEKFFRDYHFVENNESIIYRDFPENPFEKNLDKGIFIKSFTIEKFLDKDDDYITFNFSEECSYSVSKNISQKLIFEEDGDFKVRLYTITLLELLSGKIDQEKFLQTHNFGDDDELMADQFISKNPFKNSLKKGILIKEITQNNGYTTISFSKPDPAISPFIMPI